MNKSLKAIIGISAGILCLILIFVSLATTLNGDTNFQPLHSSKSSFTNQPFDGTLSTEHSNQFAALDKTITNNRLNIETKSIRKTVDSIDKLVEEHSGKYTSKSIDAGDAQYGYMSIRVPNDKAQAFVDRINKDYDVSSYNTDISDVTEQYSNREKDIEDLQAKIKLYKELEKQTPISNIEQRINIIDKVSDLERKILRLQDVNDDINKRIEYRDITITLSAPSRLSGERNYWHNTAQLIISTFQASLKVLIVLIAMAIPFVLLFVLIRIIKKLK